MNHQNMEQTGRQCFAQTVVSDYPASIICVFHQGLHCTPVCLSAQNEALTISIALMCTPKMISRSCIKPLSASKSLYDGMIFTPQPLPSAITRLIAADPAEARVRGCLDCIVDLDVIMAQTDVPHQKFEILHRPAGCAPTIGSALHLWVVCQRK